ncbi:hypothetical protein [Chitinophaga varians]|uniref:hypothetical protein n=1 Tax=Chitinophaga varians TaxID=2202339 RepID=UPI00165FE656|nr:hypothetical protein [Chitinophaga varians]MBC9912971.1 hypothetical protein [Chitinophaga varians]
MKIIRHNDHLDIVPEEGEEITLHRETVYPDRIVVFKRLSDIAWQEIHFDKNNGALISREDRARTLPSFQYHFDEVDMVAVIDYIFIDEANTNAWSYPHRDVETIRIKLFRNARVVQYCTEIDRINARTVNHFEKAKRQVDALLQQEASKRQYDMFLRETYTHWTAEHKIEYHYRRILFEDRMQGGYPSGYTSPAAPYFSKWFMDTFAAYNPDYIGTLQGIAKQFDIHITDALLREMVRYETNSDEWQTIAGQLGLLDK